MNKNTKVIGIDCCYQDIIPIYEEAALEVHTNRHPNTNGTRWGWVSGCTLNICWSNDNNFNEKEAEELVNRWNNRTKEN